MYYHYDIKHIQAVLNFYFIFGSTNNINISNTVIMSFFKNE